MVTARGGRGFVDHRVGTGDVAFPQVLQGRQPPVGFAAGQLEHLRLVRAQPDRDVVRGLRAVLHPGQLVVLAVEAERTPRFRVPYATEDLDRLGQRLDAFTRALASAAHTVDRVNEPARANAQLKAPVGEQVEARRGPGEHRGWPQRQVEHVARDQDPLGPGRDPAQQGPGVQQAHVVRVVLEGRRVQPGRFGQLGQTHHAVRIAHRRRDERTQHQVMTVVRHSNLTSPTRDHLYRR